MREDFRLELCEHCGSEGRIYRAVQGSQYAEPSEEDLGPCGECDGTGLVYVECEPVTLEDLDDERD